MFQRSIVNTAEAPQPIGAYSQAVRVKAGELVFLAGQVGIDSEGKIDSFVKTPRQAGARQG